MFRNWKYKIDLARLQRGRDKTSTHFDKLIAASSSADERQSLLASKQFELEEWDDEIDSLTTRRVLAEARQLILPIPNDPESWFTSTTFGSRYLTREAIVKLRGEIRAEHKAKWDLFSSHAGLVISLVSAMTGVLGAIIGVLAFLAKSP